MHCLETNHLVHQFSEHEFALNDINLRVAEGSIYGFLGPNGAGKTTTLRLILGLLRKQQGGISIFGKPFEKNRVAILRKVGSLIESPSLYGHLTAVENLTVWQKIYQCPKERIPEVIALVGLPDTGIKKVSQFSLGMKQRLSIAVALFHNPTLLILDEPSNGLDPQGIIEMRELLKKLNQELGMTVVISSHVLSEIEKLVSHVGIIHKGKMLFQGTLDELKSKQRELLSIVLETNNNTKAMQILSSNSITTKADGGKISLPPMTKDEIAIMIRFLVNANVDIHEVRMIRNDLEAIFMELVNH